VCDTDCAALRQELTALKAALASSMARENAEREGRLAAEEGRTFLEERLSAEVERLRSRCLAEAECHKRAAEEV
jgi:hypothetical protein